MGWVKERQNEWKGYREIPSKGEKEWWRQTDKWGSEVHKICFHIFFWSLTSNALGHGCICILTHSPSRSQFLSKVLFIFSFLSSFHERVCQYWWGVTLAPSCVVGMTAARKNKIVLNDGSHLCFYLIMKCAVWLCLQLRVYPCVCILLMGVCKCRCLWLCVCFSICLFAGVCVSIECVLER